VRFTPVGFDPDQHRLGFVVIVEMLGDQSVQLTQPGHSLGQPAAHQHPA
jgi:hypothetical protein